MGVVHKLKNEVIDFVLTMKREQPKISVRQLAELSSQKFEIHISKSSISNVLKTAQLNSPVGRPSGQAVVPPKQFTIPSDKKNQIRQSMRQIKLIEETKEIKETKPVAPPPVSSVTLKEGVEAISPTVNLPVKIVPVSSKEIFKDNVVVKKKEQEKPKEEVHPSSDDKMTLLADVLAASSVIATPLSTPVMEPSTEIDRPSLIKEESPADDSIAEQKKRWQENAGETLHAVGTIFLQAAATALTKKPFMGDMLAPHFPHDDLLYFSKLCQAETFCRGIEHFFPEAGDFSNGGFWQWLGFNQPIDRSEFQHRLIQAPMTSRLSISYAMEKEQLFLSATAIKIISQDGSQLTMDARAATIWPNTVPVDLDVPLNVVIDVLSGRIIANAKPFVLGLCPSSIIFKNLVDVFNGLNEKKIKKVSLLDHKNQEIAQFSVIPQLKRNFITAVYHAHTDFSTWQKLFPEDLRHQSYYLGLTDQVVSCRSMVTTSTSLSQEPLKCVEVSYPQTKKPFCILISNQLEAGEENLLREYSGAWPYWAEGLLGGLFQGKANAVSLIKRSGSLSKPASTFKSIDDLFIDYFQFLHQTVIDLFGKAISEELEIDWFIKNIYLRKGSCRIDNNRLNVTLQPAADSQIMRVLDIIIREINEKNITDKFGQKINVMLSKS